jgi:hypothetical protein
VLEPCVGEPLEPDLARQRGRQMVRSAREGGVCPGVASADGRGASGVVNDERAPAGRERAVEQMTALIAAYDGGPRVVVAGAAVEPARVVARQAAVFVEGVGRQELEQVADPGRFGDSGGRISDLAGAGGRLARGGAT